MAFRTLEITTPAKLDYSLNYLNCRTAENTKRFCLDELETIIISTTSVSITASLIVELIKKKINVVFCDEKHNPQSQVLPLYGSFNCFQSLKNQMNWSNQIKDKVWKEIIKEKIRWQGEILKKYSPGDENYLFQYIDKVLDGDISNCEGHCAKHYFNRLFSNDFSRDDPCDENTFLNYGYSILLSEINRYIVCKGYLTRLGIHHCNQNNEFNLSCDMMEPFRPIIDDYIHQVNCDNFKIKLVSLFQNAVLTINDTRQTMKNAISIYVSSVLQALDNEDLSYLSFFSKYEL